MKGKSKFFKWLNECALEKLVVNQGEGDSGLDFVHSISVFISANQLC